MPCAHFRRENVAVVIVARTTDRGGNSAIHRVSARATGMALVASTVYPYL
jgi:hypothetical protein